MPTESERDKQTALQTIAIGLLPEEKSILSGALQGILPTLDEVIMVVARLAAARVLYGAMKDERR